MQMQRDAPRDRSCSHFMLLPRYAPPLRAAAEVPQVLRQPFIDGSYRYGLTWRQCVASLFHKHNESWNIW
jgi:hypothetical protein